MTICKKCGRSYVESYDLCPGCGHRRKASKGKLKKNAGSPRKSYKSMALITVLLVLAALVLNIAGIFPIFETKPGNSGAGLAGHEGDIVGLLYAEAVRCGIPVKLVGARFSGAVERDTILAAELVDGAYEAVISLGAQPAVPAGEWTCRLFSDVEAELGRLGINCIEATKIYDPGRMEGLILGAFIGDNEIQPGDLIEADSVMSFSVVTHSEEDAMPEPAQVLQDAPVFDPDAAFDADQLIGMEIDAAHRYLRHHEKMFYVARCAASETYGRGVVCEIKSEPGCYMLTVSAGLDFEIIVPNITGLNQQDAAQALMDAGVRGESIVFVRDNRIYAECGSVTGASVTAGAALTGGQVLYVYVYGLKEGE